MAITLGKKGKISLNRVNITALSGLYTLPTTIQSFDLGSPSDTGVSTLSSNIVTLNISNGPGTLFFTISNVITGVDVEYFFLTFAKNSLSAGNIYDSAGYITRVFSVSNGNTIQLLLQLSLFGGPGIFSNCSFDFEVRQTDATGTILDTGTFTIN